MYSRLANSRGRFQNRETSKFPGQQQFLQAETNQNACEPCSFENEAPILINP
jgi:hypothetical protein